MLDKFTKKESPILGYAGFGGGVSSLLTLASGTPTYIDEVFSTFLYDGTSSAQTITNGIDLDGEGGLVWLKDRTPGWGHQHQLFDTERGATKVIYSDSDVNEATDTNGVTAFNSNGFSIGTTGSINYNGNIYCSWTFRKCPGFFDVVTYTGNGNSGGQTISHSLGSIPGSIWIKRTSSPEDWCVYHRSIGTAGHARLNKTTTYLTNQKFANVTSTSFDVYDDDVMINGNGDSYVAYIFAHNDGSFGEDSDEAVIKCGTYAGTGSDGNKITLGFEPQWLLIKNVDDGATDWAILDIMRGANYQTGVHLRANLNTQEYSNTDLRIDLHADGFSVNANNTMINGTNGENFIYIAIRRPHKPPEVATEVFDVNTESNDNNYSTTGFPVDAAISINRDGSSHTSLFGAKLIGENVLRTGLSNSEAAYLTYNTAYAFMDKFRYAFWGSNTNGFVNYAFKRAPGFFDVVAVNSTTSAASTFNHNLGATPEFIIAKRRDATSSWLADQVNNYLRLNTDNGNLGTPVFNTLTSTQFSVDAGTFSSGESWIVFLFATLPGISKVGSYAGTGNDINVDCGFTNGARFVLIKRTDTSGDWYVLDSVRGIVSGNDPFMRLNLTNGENNNSDNLDPLSSGFTVVAGAPSDINANGGTYLFLAIA